jgi:SAM-dependent methyltransferase
MADPHLQNQIEAARAYEALHVPALFGQWATPVLDAVGVKAGDRVLDVACGTGVLGRTALARVGNGGSVAGIDPDPGMIAVASELTPAAEWRLGLAEELPYPDATFDTVVSQFGMMFFEDRPGAVREMLRVVPPGGTIAVAVWDGLDNTEAYPEAVDLFERMAGPDAAEALQAPFVLGDAGARGRELTRPAISAGCGTVHAPRARRGRRTIRPGSGPRGRCAARCGQGRHRLAAARAPARWWSFGCPGSRPAGPR